MPELIWNRYGKSRVRLVKVRRPPTRCRTSIVDLTIDVQLEGAFETVYVDGDNGPCLATDTMKNTVYALARQDPIAHVEGVRDQRSPITSSRSRRVTRVRISAFEQPWERLSVAGRPHPHAFVQPGGEQWTTVVTRDAGRHRGRLRRGQPGRPEDDRLGVLRISARRVHDAAGDRGSDPRDRR